jgi:hypothetical protein
VAEIERDALFSDEGEHSIPSGLSAPIPVERKVPTFAASMAYGTTPAVPAAVARKSLPPPTPPSPRMATRTFLRDTHEHTSTRELMALVRGSITGGPFGIRRRGGRILTILAAATVGVAVFGVVRARSQRVPMADVKPRATAIAQTRPATSAFVPIPVASAVVLSAQPTPSPPESSATFRPAGPAARRPIQPAAAPTAPNPPAPIPPAPTWVRSHETPVPVLTHTTHQEPPTPPPTPTAAPSSTNCDPPFWYDADGNKRYYRNCTGP